MVQDAWEQYILGSRSRRAEEQKESQRRTSPNKGCVEAAGATLWCVATTQEATLYHSLVSEALEVKGEADPLSHFWLRESSRKQLLIILLYLTLIK